MPRFAIWGVICLLVGAGFFLNALLIVLRRRRFLDRAEAAEGTVVAVRTEGAGRNITSFPTVEFTTRSGVLGRAESLMGTGVQSFAVGQQVPVRYDPRDPSRAEVATFATLWGTALLRAGFGAAFVVMGSVAIIAGALKP